MWPFNRKDRSGFSSSSTAEEVTEGVDGSGLTAVITGASSGIGAETARVLALRGVHVVMGVRNLSAGNTVREDIVKKTPAAKVDVLELDLSSKSSVRKFALEFCSMNLPLNILINNAGIMACPFSLSHDGMELQFATNHIGHFLLTHLLLENMKNTSHKNNTEGRIVNVSSEAHRFTYKEGIRFDKINDESGYSKFLAYGQSKLANILHANALSRRFKEEEVNITCNSLHPGIIATNIMRYPSFISVISSAIGRLAGKSIEQGSATTCFVALNPQVKGVTGKYFNNSKMSEPSPRACDGDLANKLWDFSIDVIAD